MLLNAQAGVLFRAGMAAGMAPQKRNKRSGRFAY